jgi:hypothetical protein
MECRGKRCHPARGCRHRMTVCAALPPAANASARGRRAAILARPLSELTGFNLAVDCLTPGCGGERSFAIAALASFYGRDRTIGNMLRRTRCSGVCSGRVEAAWLMTGPVLNARADRGVWPCGGRRRGSEQLDRPEPTEMQ